MTTERDIHPGQSQMEPEGAIEEQLRERLDRSRALALEKNWYTLDEYLCDRSRECAALRRLCREALEGVSLFPEVADKLRAAANGEEVRG